MNLTEHVLKVLCLKSLQVVIENVPESLLDHATLPVGAEPEPTIVALHVTVPPTTTESWLQDRVKVIGEALTVIVLHPPVAGRLFASPL
jgi:hypothetical protein